MKRCDDCGEWIVYENHDCGPILRRREAEAETYQRYAEERALRKMEVRQNTRFFLAVFLSALAVFILGVIALKASTGGDEEARQSAVSNSSASQRPSYMSPSATTTARTTTEAPSSSGIDPDLQRRGMTRQLLDELNLQAAGTGYSGARGSLMSESILEPFAGGMISVCDDVRAGYTDWASETQRDIADGAPRSAAERMNGFLQREFCPQVVG